MRVTKRSGAFEAVDLNKIVRAVRLHCKGLSYVDPMRVATKTVSGLFDGATTVQLDSLSIQTASELIAEEPEYGQLAARMLATVIHKEVSGSVAKGSAPERFSDLFSALFTEGLINTRVLQMMRDNSAVLNAAIRNDRDYLFEYFALRTLYDRYLLKHPTTRKRMETPQSCFMRVALGVSDTVDQALELYEMLSTFRYLPGSPTLFNAGTKHEQLSSCYLLDSPEDSLEGIYKNYTDIAKLSKWAGGIGVAYHRVRSQGSLIKGTNGPSNGIISFLKTLDSSVASINQGSLRKGAACVYLETWHADIEDFLELRDNTGDEARRTHNLNLANWIPDLFMKRVEKDADWTLFDPAVVPKFPDLYGAEFEEAYEAAEKEGKGKRVVKARDLYARMMRTLAQTGNGWMTWKDQSNIKSNQTGRDAKGNGGTIHLSNLCVAPDTLILTRDGHVPIITRVDQPTDVWNGKEYSTVTVRKTASRVKLVSAVVELTHVTGRTLVTLDTTPAHKYILPGGERVEASTLKQGQRLASFRLPGDTHDTHAVVSSVTDNGRVSDTYCFNEPIEHAGVFNGVLTGQCTEILEVNDADNISVCNLASVNLSLCVVNGSFNFKHLAETVSVAVRQLDRVIDRNFYPVPEAERSNNTWRPVGLGLMGLQDVFFKLRMPFDSVEARALSKQISEHIYYHALKTSNELAKELGAHKNFEQTRAAKGVLQFHQWGVEPTLSGWSELTKEIIAHGLRNSLLIAIAPTATIGTLASVYECIEPQLSNLFKRETLSGEFMQVNKHLTTELRKIGMWNQDTRNKIKLAEGSIQGIDGIPQELKDIYRTSWEIQMRSLIDMAADRGAFIDQSQSLNLYIESPNVGKLSSMYMYAWQKGLKTTYYLRSRPATKIAKVSAVASDTAMGYGPVASDAKAIACSLENPESCESCQ